MDTKESWIRRAFSSIWSGIHKTVEFVTRPFRWIYNKVAESWVGRTLESITNKVSNFLRSMPTITYYIVVGGLGLLTILTGSTTIGMISLITICVGYMLFMGSDVYNGFLKLMEAMGLMICGFLIFMLWNSFFVPGIFTIFQFGVLLALVHLYYWTYKTIEGMRFQEEMDLFTKQEEPLPGLNELKEFVRTPDFKASLQM